MQPPYSMLTRRIEEEVRPFCAAEAIAVVTYSPLMKGL
jgi:aryl-alcohol dehydrogenase-like predicted oxidoreductase